MTSAILATTQIHHGFKRLARTLLTGVCAFACCTAVALTSAQAGLRRISGTSPFASCTADNPTGQVGTLYPDSEIEPWIDVNPSNGQNLIAAWQQDRWSNGGARGLVAGVSIDGGLNWARIVPPKVSKCSGGIYDRASDPWVTISPNGRAYFMSLAFMQDRPDGGFGQNALLVSRSLNGGISWSNPTPLIIDTSGQILNDKNSMTADPFSSNFVYGVWDRLQDFTLPPGSHSAKTGKATSNRGGDGVVLAREQRRKMAALAASGELRAEAVPTFFKGPAYFTRTTNGGQSWEIPKKIHDPGANSQTINNLVEVLANGTVADFFTSIVNKFVGGGFVTEIHIGMVKSGDKGKTFGKATLPVEMNVTFNGTRTPDFKEPVRDANILFDVAVDRGNGNIYLVWQDGRWGNLDKVAFSQSTDGGLTFSAPVQINMTPRSDVRLRNQAFVPSVAVGSRHEIVVTYYDFRFDTSDARERTDYFAVFCTPSQSVDCSRRASWGDRTNRLKDVRLTPYSFDMLNAPVARGHFLGDYMGLVRRGGSVFPAFGIAGSPNHTSIFTNRIFPDSSTLSSRSP
jgi:hypothetical protein